MRSISIIAAELVAHLASGPYESHRAAEDFHGAMARAILLRQDLDALHHDGKVPMTVEDRGWHNGEVERVTAMHDAALYAANAALLRMPAIWVAAMNTTGGK